MIRGLGHLKPSEVAAGTRASDRPRAGGREGSEPSAVEFLGGWDCLKDQLALAMSLVPQLFAIEPVFKTTPDHVLFCDLA